jgi:prevent-host-death family protein
MIVWKYLYNAVVQEADPMKTVSVAEARSRFKALLDEVSAGHPVSVVRRGREVARLVPPRRKARRLPALGPLRASIRVTGEAASRTVVRARREARY